MTSTLGRIALYLTLGTIAFVALVSFSDRIEDGNEARERLAVEHARRWHKSYVVSRREVDKLSVVAKRAVAKSDALRDSVRVISDTTVIVERDTVEVPRLVIRRLVADSVTIASLTQLVAVQGNALIVADSTIAAYQTALAAAQANRPNRLRRAVTAVRHATVGAMCGTIGWAVGGPAAGIGVGAVCAAVSGVVK